jgi:3-oxoacyl-[acyl-carrier-protein] synthase-3
VSASANGRRPDAYVRGLGVCLPSTRYEVAAAVEAGIYDVERATRDGFTSVAVEPSLYPVDLAPAACRAATATAPATEISSLIYTSIHRHGHKTLWPPASYLHRHLGMRPDALAYSLNQGCNGAFVAAKVALSHLHSGDGTNVLVAGADRFEETLFDRWNSDLGTVYGDAGSAVLLSTVPGALRVLCLELESGTELEEMYRNTAPSAEHDGSARLDYDVGAAKRSYFSRQGRDGLQSIFTATLGRLRAKLVADHALDKAPAAYVLYPNVGAGISAEFYERAFADLARRDLWDYGRSIGHTGVSDQFVGLAHLLDSQALATGDRVLLVGAGNGLSAGVMLLEMTNASVADQLPVARHA